MRLEDISRISRVFHASYQTNQLVLRETSFIIGVGLIVKKRCKLNKKSVSCPSADRDFICDLGSVFLC